MKRIFLLTAIIFITALLILAQEKSDIHENESCIQEKEKIQDICNYLRQKAKEDDLSELPENLFRLNIEIDALDSLLRNIDIPKNIEINGETIRINNITERQGIVKFGDDVIIGRNEIVNGDVVVFGGNATVYGTIRGGIVVLAGNVRLTSTSSVKDDVICIWGDTEINSGAQIAGKTNVFNLGKIFQNTLNIGIFPTAIIFLRFLRIILIFIIALIIYAAFPTQTERIRDKIAQDYAKSLLIGFISLLLIPILFIILLATIIGIPIAILLLPIIIIGGFLFGFTAFGLLLGQYIRNYSGLKTSSPFILLVLGILGLEILPFLNKMTLLFSHFLSTLFFLGGILIFFVTWVPGFGAVILTRFGTMLKPQDSSPDSDV